ncbi:MAG: flotillin domain-containing protein [Paraclostridium sp.]
MFEMFESSFLLAVGGIVVLLLLFITGYVKAPTDKAFIISGLRKEPRIVIGRATIKIPFLERKDELIAEQKKAEGISVVGKAEAEAIKAKLLAEAEGLDKKADAMSKMQQAAVIEMVIDKLPEIVKNAAAPLANVDSITMYGEGNGAKMVGDIMTTTDKVIKGLEGAVGLDIKSLITGALGGALITNNKNGFSEEDAEVIAYKIKSEIDNNIIDRNDSEPE